MSCSLLLGLDFYSFLTSIKSLFWSCSSKTIVSTNLSCLSPSSKMWSSIKNIFYWRRNIISDWSLSSKSLTNILFCLSILPTICIKTSSLKLTLSIFRTSFCESFSRFLCSCICSRYLRTCMRSCLGIRW